MPEPNPHPNLNLNLTLSLTLTPSLNLENALEHSEVQPKYLHFPKMTSLHGLEILCKGQCAILPALYNKKNVVA